MKLQLLFPIQETFINLKLPDISFIKISDSLHLGYFISARISIFEFWPFDSSQSETKFSNSMPLIELEKDLLKKNIESKTDI